MPLKIKKIRRNITFEVPLKSKLESIAKQQGRSFNNLVITVLKQYVLEYERRKNKESKIYYESKIKKV